MFGSFPSSNSQYGEGMWPPCLKTSERSERPSKGTRMFPLDTGNRVDIPKGFNNQWGMPTDKWELISAVQLELAPAGSCLAKHWLLGSWIVGGLGGSWRGWQVESMSRGFVGVLRAEAVYHLWEHFNKPQPVCPTCARQLTGTPGQQKGGAWLRRPWASAEHSDTCRFPVEDVAVMCVENENWALSPSRDFPHEDRLEGSRDRECTMEGTQKNHDVFVLQTPLAGCVGGRPLLRSLTVFKCINWIPRIAKETNYNYVELSKYF